jgi:ABC-2 type transport system ATP-binding protein
MNPSDPVSAPAPAEAPVIELDGLRVKFGSKEILKGLSGALSGRSIGLLGPNGAGKTTLLHTLLGFHPPADGTARVFGWDIRRDFRQIRRLAGYMPENECFVAGMSAIRLTRLLAEITGLPAGVALERSHEALTWAGLGEARYRPVGTYSLGMRQSFKLAQAIVHGPQLLILDEPTNGLDPPARQRMIRLIREIRDSGHTRILLSTHLLRDAEELCDEVIILKAGAIASVCDLEQERQANRKFIELEIRGDAEPFLELAEHRGCECAVTGKGRIKMVLPEGVEIRDLFALAAGREIQIRRLNYKRDSLQDIFLKAMENGHGSLQA